MISPVYWHPVIYQLFLRIIFGRQFKIRYQEVASFIPNGSCVVDICCGDCTIYRYFLRKKNVQYLGLDINLFFVRWLKKKRIPIRLFDVYKDEIPPAEYIIMLGSLYQFIPHHKEIMDKMLKAATKKVIITERIQGAFSSSTNSLISYIAKRLANPGTGHAMYRFNEKKLIRFLMSYGTKLERYYKICNNTQIVAVLKADKKS